MKSTLVIALAACAGCTGSGGATGDLAQDSSVSTGSWVALDLSTRRIVPVEVPLDTSDPRWLGDRILFRQIDAGIARTGRPVADPLVEVDEYPRRSIGHGRVWIAAHELTQRQWRLLTASEPWYAVLPLTDPAAFVGDNLPAIGISPLMAETACSAYGLAGWTLSLPEAAEWELACTGNRNQRFTWGDAVSAEEAAHHVVCDAPAPLACGGRTANPMGMHDMHGNAWEIVRGDYGWEARGGGWDQPLLTARSSNRLPLTHDDTGWSIGLRLVLRR